MPARPGFNPALKHYIRSDFKFNGRKYQAGNGTNIFPWRQNGCSIKTLRNLYYAGKLKYDIDGELDELEAADEDIDLDDVSENVSENSSNESNDSNDESDESDTENEPEDDSDSEDDDSDDSEGEDESEDDEDEEKQDKSSKKELPKPRRKRTRKKK